MEIEFCRVDLDLGVVNEFFPAFLDLFRATVVPTVSVTAETHGFVGEHIFKKAS